jgi:hypothetical protein
LKGEFEFIKRPIVDCDVDAVSITMKIKQKFDVKCSKKHVYAIKIGFKKSESDLGTRDS